MLAKVLAPAVSGVTGVVIEVECDITNGLPSFIVVGLGNQAINEARDRVRSAIRNSQLLLPPKRITLNLAPADLPKDGTAYDVGMAIAILLASGQLDQVTDCLFIGELALDGSLRPVRGVLAYAQLAAEQNIKNLFVPSANAPEAGLIEGITVYGARNLLEIYGHLAGLEPLTAITASPTTRHQVPDTTPDFSAIAGQDEAKRALEITAAGGHNIILIGPPGAGKTMMSRALIGIMPPPSLSELIEITKIHGLTERSSGTLRTQRPFRNPHHTASDVALIGGGRTPRPGEISLSHHGVLFLDELPEFRKDVLEVLRQPLEDGVVTIARASATHTFPAEFILVGAQNPCPCGYAGDPIKQCNCSLSQVLRYNRKLSGPLLDRIDMVVHVQRVQPDILQHGGAGETSARIAQRVQVARKIQFERQNGILNARLAGDVIRTHATLRTDAQQLLSSALTQTGLSARGYIRTLKVARTIADLEMSPETQVHHISEALNYRPTA